jgi:chemotaxis protein methyltransferase CheR
MTGSLAGVRELIRERTGIRVPESREAALLGALHRVAPGLSGETFLAAVADPEHGPALLGRLVDEITVQETSFLRDREQLDAIPWHSLQRCSARGGTLRIWSTACASGEEAYTLALLATEAFTPGPAAADVLGTDISGAALAQAAAGQYGERAVRGLTAAQRQRYLERQPGGGYHVGRELRSKVRFRRHNLALDLAPPPGEGPFDLIVCRNVLIYFEAPAVSRVTVSLERSLRPGGMLMFGAADTMARRASAAPGPPATGGLSTGGTGLGTGGAGRRRLDRRPPWAPPGSRPQRLLGVLEAAGAGRTDEAKAQVSALLAEDPLDADANFVQGLVALEDGDPARAATALRAALYSDPVHAPAAFTLGRAYDALGDRAAADRAYTQALRALDQPDRRHERLLQQIHLADIAAACRARLEGRS